MALITLTTDFGYKDHFVAAMKGKILDSVEHVRIVDISHDIAPFNIKECAYILENSYANFPKGSIHIVGVDAEPTEDKQHIAVLVNGHYFVTANTGVIGLITSEMQVEKAIAISLPNTKVDAFPSLGVLVPVACHLARGGTLEVVGKPFDGLKELREFTPTIVDQGKRLKGSVIYIDNYGNLVSNIKRSLFEGYRNNRDFEILVRNHKIKEIHTGYVGMGDGRQKTPGDGDLLALFNSSGYLELAIYRSNLKTVGGAATLLGMDYRDTVIIEFK